MTLQKKVVLIGPMGAGKTTLGNILAARFACKYFDNDHEMTTLYGFSQEELSSMSVSELHTLESRYLADILKKDAPFITGAAASVVDYPANCELLTSATSIYLRIPLEQVLVRAGSTGVGRQALTDGGEKLLTERYLRRDPIYKEVAALTVDLSDQPQRDADVIASFLNA